MTEKPMFSVIIARSYQELTGVRLAAFAGS